MTKHNQAMQNELKQLKAMQIELQQSVGDDPKGKPQNGDNCENVISPRPHVMGVHQKKEFNVQVQGQDDEYDESEEFETDLGDDGESSVVVIKDMEVEMKKKPKQLLIQVDEKTPMFSKS